MKGKGGVRGRGGTLLSLKARGGEGKKIDAKSLIFMGSGRKKRKK